MELVREILNSLGGTLFAYTEIQMDDWNERDDDSTLLQEFNTAKKVNTNILVSVIEEMSDILDTLKIFLQHSLRTAYERA
jgi:uncharacterized sporulation protein YeaH/YhbH (DUF444 family)